MKSLSAFKPGLAAPHVHGTPGGSLLTWTGAPEDLADGRVWGATEGEHYPLLTIKTLIPPDQPIMARSSPLGR